MAAYIWLFNKKEIVSLLYMCYHVIELLTVNILSAMTTFIKARKQSTCKYLELAIDIGCPNRGNTFYPVTLLFSNLSSVLIVRLSVCYAVFAGI